MANLKHNILFLSTVPIFFITFNLSVLGQSIDEKFWVPNNTVFSTVRSGNTIYIGGAFTQIGPLTGYGAEIDLNTAEVDLSNGKVNGPVFTVIEDGSGGWFMGGFFSKVDNVTRNNLAHIESDGTLDANWNPNANYIVFTMAILENTMYMGGLFTSVDGSTRNYIAAIDVITGQVIENWNPGANAQVTDIQISDNLLYVCGEFTNIAGQDRNYIASINAVTGTATNWNPNANSYVNTIYISGSTIYAGGKFTSIGAQVPQPTRNRIAELNASTGEATNWNPNISGGANPYVSAITKSGSTVYAGGNFNYIGGNQRINIGAINATSGYPTNWAPNANYAVWALEVSGSTVYAGGCFNIIGSQTRNFIAALSTEDGSPTSWDPNANDVVRTFAISGSKMYLGGDFWIVGGVERNGIAAIDATTGIPTDWNPDPVDAIGDTAHYSVGYVINFDLNKCEEDPFEPVSLRYSTTLTSPFVETLAISGSSIYVGGVFTEIGGQTRYNIAELDLETGQATGWNPDANGIVDVITVSGSNVYVGGSFTYIGQRTRYNIAAIGENGIATIWDPNADSRVLALSVSGSEIYAGGFFTSIGPQTRHYIAKIDEHGIATDWNPDADDWVYSLALSDPVLYVGGEFDYIGGAERHSIAAIDIESGRATDWDPDATGGGQPPTSIRTIKVSGSKVYVGGNFTEIGEEERISIAALDKETGKATDWDVIKYFGNPPPFVYSIEVSNSIVYMGGCFLEVMNELRPLFAVVSADEATAVITPVVSGWQTLSVPVVVDDFAKTTVWATADPNSNAFSFCGSVYVPEDTLENGVGYFVKFNSAQDIFYAGEFLEQIETPVCAGWNIVGSISEEVPTSSNVCLFPGPNSFTSSFFIFRNGYQIVKTIIPGMGHWIRVAMDGSILVNIDPIQCDSESPESLEEEGMDHFIVTDANGKKQDLYVANLDLNPSLGEMDLSMPPPLPEVGFDARFEEGEYIKPVSPDSGEVELVINVEAQDYPITLSWELNSENGMTYSFIGDSIVGKISEIKSKKGNISFNETGKNKIRLMASADRIINSINLPSVYSLMQNFPNPFNPTTMIKYALPKVSNVKLTVYDILGREVSTLVNEQQQPGSYQVTWNASNVASGIYFYQLKAGNFVDTKKMILIR
jgi:hypothetical protein